MPPVPSAVRRGEGRELGGMDRGRAGPGGSPVDSNHPPLCNAGGLQIRRALPCRTRGGSASQLCLLPANPSLQKTADPETGGRGAWISLCEKTQCRSLDGSLCARRPNAEAHSREQRDVHM